MKNLFLAFALTGFVGAATISTAAVITHAKVIYSGGEECKKCKNGKKGSTCCKDKATTNANTEKGCSSSATKSCCTMPTGGHSTAGNKKPAQAPPVKSSTKVAEQEK